MFDPWLEQARADALMAALATVIPWAQHEIDIAGRQIPQPRLSAWFGDPGASYTYSGLSLSPAPWPDLVAQLRADVEAATGARFNSVLMNLYRDGADSMGWHADAEKALGPDPLIASVSLGAHRRFLLRHRKRTESPVELELGGGSLVLIGGATQHHWRHAVPKTRRPVGPRINLTFRRILAADAISG